MLPAWAAVVIALAGGLITALAGVTGAYIAFRGSTFSAKSQVAEAWRTRLIDASHAFIAAYADVVRAVENQIYEPDEPPLDEDAKLALNAAYHGALQAQLTISLLFGRSSPAARAAEGAVNEISHPVGYVLARCDADQSTWEEKRTELYDRRNDRERRYDEFVSAAHAVIEPPLISVD